MKNILRLIPVFLLLLAISGNAQLVEKAVKGTVYDLSTGENLSGVQVVIPGVASALTDEKGEFVLEKTIPNAVVLVKSPGYASRQVSLKGAQILRIGLLDDSYKGKYESLNEPFEVENALNTPYALSSHENRRDYLLGASTIETVFQNSLSGMQTVSRSAMAGSGSNLSVMGINSLNSNTQPLIVVDGVEYDNEAVFSLISGNVISPLSDIDVKDIDQISVLKSGASMYGSKGSNGVVFINTLDAKNVATRINFYSYAGVNLEPVAGYRLMDAGQYKSYLTDMLYGQGMTENEVQSLPYINMEKPVQEAWGISGNADYYRYNQNTDWQKEVFRSSISQNYHLNITGGNDNALYAISFGYLGTEGTKGDNNFNRYTTRVNAKIKMTDWFSLHANVSFVYADRDLSDEGLRRNYNPLYAGLIKAPFSSPYIYDMQGGMTPNLEGVDMFNVSNPTSIMENALTANDRFRFFGTMAGIVTFNPYLTATLKANITTDKVTERIFLPQAGIYHEALADGAIRNESQQLRYQIMHVNADARLQYARVFDYTHDLKIRAGMRYQNARNELDWGKAFNTSSDEMKTLGDGLSTLAKVGGSIGSWAYASAYLNAEYGLKNKYYAALNVSADASSRFGSGAVGVFPGINLAWLTSSEDFMSGQDIVDVLKLRAGYSISGNHDIGNYSSRYYYTSEGLLGAYGLVRANIPNPNLKWESSAKVNVGVDASFLDERLNISLDLYNNRVTDLIRLKEIASYSGMSSAIINDGSMQNLGAELNVTSRLINQKNFKWDLGLMASSYKNELLRISGNEYLTEFAGATIQTKVGQPVAQFYGYRFEGVFASQTEADAAGLKIQNPDGAILPFGAGDAKFADLDGNKIINEADKQVIGNPNPSLFGAINNSLKWNSWSLNAVFTYSVGNDIYNALRSDLESMSNTDNQTMAVMNRWRTDGQNTTIPKAVWGDPMGNSRFSSRWIEDGSYLRVKSVSVAYDFKVKSEIVNSVQVYLTGNNLFTFTNYLGYDPESSVSQNPIYMGIDTGATPQAITVLAGVKVGL